MKITYFNDYHGMSERASNMLVEELRKKKESLVCCATGNSPTGLYQNLAKVYSVETDLFDKMRILKLDEWGGIPMSDSNSCHSYLKEYVLTPLKISSDRYLAFNSEVENVAEECKRIQQAIDEKGPIDFCILGIGKNGHIALNEPSDFLQWDCHVAQLAASTLNHSMVQSMSQVPRFGMTIGLKAIFGSRKILLLITGSQKQEVFKRLLTKEITTQLPASLLWLHPNVECLVDNYE